MVSRATLPALQIPQRRQSPEIDGIAMGKELTGLIRGAKTRGAINKALAQYGSLSSPEAIESVRQNMGTWFSDPQTIIALQDKAHKSAVDAEAFELEKRKVGVNQAAVDAQIYQTDETTNRLGREADAKVEAAEVLAEATVAAKTAKDIKEVQLETLRIAERDTDAANTLTAARLVATTLKSTQDAAIEKTRLTTVASAALATFNAQIDSIDQQLLNLNAKDYPDEADARHGDALMKRRGSIVDNFVKKTMTPTEFEQYLKEQEVNKGPSRQAIEVQLKANSVTKIEALGDEDYLNSLSNSWTDWSEPYDQLNDAMKEQKRIEKVLAMMEGFGDYRKPGAVFAGHTKEGHLKELERANVNIQKLRKEFEPILLKDLQNSNPANNTMNQLQSRDPATGQGLLSSVGGEDLIDQFTQMILSSPQGQEMMRARMEEQQRTV